MAVIQSGVSSSQLTVDPVALAARSTLYDAAGAVVGSALNPLAVMPGSAPLPTNGGFYTATGRTGTAAIAASLASDTSLAAMRFAAASTRTCYVEMVQVFISIITVGTSALVPGTLGLQRFTSGNPSGGTSRTAAELNEGAPATDMTVIQDLNAALTMTSVVFGGEIASAPVPIVITGSTSSFEWVVAPATPIRLAPGDGLVLRTRVACPATQTWMFTWNAVWSER